MVVIPEIEGGLVKNLVNIAANRGVFKSKETTDTNVRIEGRIKDV